MELIYEKSKIPNSLIDECNILSSETGEIYFIFDISLSSTIKSNYSKEIEEKRELSLDSLLDKETYHIGTIDDFNQMPSRFSYYDTETKETDRYKKYKIVENYIKSIGFTPNEFNFGPEYEQSYTLYIEDSENPLLLIVRVSPNLMLSIRDGYTSIIIYNGFFSRGKIIDSIRTITTEDKLRDFKISIITN